MRILNVVNNTLSIKRKILSNLKRVLQKKKKTEKLTLTVKLADDSVQVGVLESDMTSSNRHFVAESGDFSNTNSLPTATKTQFFLLVLHITGREYVTETELHGAKIIRANVDAK